MTKTNKSPAAGSAYAGLGAALGGMDALGGLLGAQHEETPVMIAMADIDPPGPQVRTEFEDDENTNEEFDASVREHGILQSLLLRILPDGRYRIVAGERRYRSATRVGLEYVPAIPREMTDEQEAAMQMAENIQRKNLTQFELAKRLQRDLDELGSVEAVMAKHHKGRAWVSKVLTLNKIEPGQQAHRLVAEKLSADVEVINAVRTIEKLNPDAAKSVVDQISAGGGKVNAREAVNKVKNEVKPSKKAKGAAKGTAGEAPDDGDAESSPAAQPAPAVQSKEAPKAAKAAGKGKGQAAMSAEEIIAVLDRAYANITEFGADPKVVHNTMLETERVACNDWLSDFFDKGVGAMNVSRTVITGLRDGGFSTKGAGAFAMSAYLDGTDLNAQFSLLDVLASVKP
ncbi:ParB/RepB/Spo0J family partition protein [Achromobacter spanius]|uniref:ParB/RepB/Spo0J family partition protein n=1 Tax=Achromobacter spanius TaxID=217203 RepID=UPI00381EE947